MGSLRTAYMHTCMGGICFLYDEMLYCQHLTSCCHDVEIQASHFTYIHPCSSFGVACVACSGCSDVPPTSTSKLFTTRVILFTGCCGLKQLMHSVPTSHMLLSVIALHKLNTLYCQTQLCASQVSLAVLSFVQLSVHNSCLSRASRPWQTSFSSISIAQYMQWQSCLLNVNGICLLKIDL